MCSKSETIGKIAAALVAFSGEVKAIEKDGTNPHFKSDYTTLDHMIDETKPILHKHGLTVMQFPGGDGERVTVRTMVLHTSGEWIESEPLTLKAVKMDPQGAGSAITYARRYSYAAALSLSLGDDDDGNASSHAPQGTQIRAQAAPQNNTNHQQQAPTSAPAASTDLISENQIKYAYKLKKDKNINDIDFQRIISEHGAQSIKELPKSAASRFINLLVNYVASEPEYQDSLQDLPF